MTETDRIHAIPDEDSADVQSLSGTTLASSIISSQTIVPSLATNTDLEHRFFKANNFSSKAIVRSSAGKVYLLVADINRSKPSSMRLYAGGNKNAALLGTLSFRLTYNDFQIFIGDDQRQLIQVRARVGLPHPSAYSFTLPATATSRPRSVAWRSFGPQSSATGYHLYEVGTNFLIASWQLTPKEKHQSVLRWYVDPGQEELETAVLLAWIGGMTRLKLKGMDFSERPNGLGRWNSMWFMAVLGTAAVG